MTSDAPTKGGNLRIVLTNNVVWANQKTESFVFRWLPTLAMFDVTCFPAFVGASDIISSLMSIHLLNSTKTDVGHKSTKMAGHLSKPVRYTVMSFSDKYLTEY